MELPDRRLSYAALREEGRALAGRLHGAGLGPGDRVGLLLQDRGRVAAGMLACLQLGCTFVPLDPATPVARLRACLEVADCACLIVEAGSEAQAEALGPAPALDWAVSPAGAAPTHRWDPDGCCYLTFTSGSSGTPKAIAGRLRGLDHFIRWEQGFLAEPGPLRVSQLTTPSFDAFLRDLFLPLCTGGTCCAPPPSARSSAAALLSWLEAAQINVLHCVPSVFRLLLDADLRPASLPALRHALLAGEPLRVEDARRWWGLFEGRIRLVNLYGPSETTMVKLHHVVTRADLDRPSIPIGQPMEGAEVLLLDEDCEPAAEGEVGEIGIRTEYGALGYFRQPALTAQRFLPGGLYLTGDHGRRLEGGELEYLGRRDRQVKLRGLRVELDEIEVALRRCKGVREAAAELRALTGGEEALVAWVSLEPGWGTAEVQQELAGLLPEGMLPAALGLVAALPRTMSGKLDRRSLVDPRRRGPPQPAALGPAEQALAGLWRGLLGEVSPRREDSFFALGGDSLLAARLVARVRAHFGVELSLERVLRRPGLAEMAEELSALGPVAAPGLHRQPAGSQALLFTQAALWELDRLIGYTGALNLGLAYLLRGPLDLGALRRALAELQARHPALRSLFYLQEGRLVQVVEDQLDLPWAVVDLRGRERKEVEALRGALQREALLSPARRPAWTATLLRLDEEEAQLVLVTHHIISDGASLAILCRELTASYAGQPLPPAQVSPADCAAWQRAQLTEERAQALLQRSIDRLGRAPPTPALAPDHPATLLPDLSGGRRSICLPAALVEALQHVARRESATLFMVLHAGFQLLLGALSGAGRVWLPSPVAGRPLPEMEEVVAPFLNVVVMGAEAGDDPPLPVFLHRVREDCLAALAEQELPFQRLVEALPAGDGLHHPLLQVSFNLLNMGSLDLTLPGLQVEALELEGSGATVGLAMVLELRGGELLVQARYASALYEAATIDGLLHDYRALLSSMVERPERRVSELTRPRRRPAPPPRRLAPDLAPPPEMPSAPLAEGAPAPLWLVPPPGLGAACYGPLTAQLGRPAHALPAAPSPRLQDRAAQLAATLRLALPNGPWLLCAWSLAAPLALATAAQLGRAGLVLLDPVAPSSPAQVDRAALLQLAQGALRALWTEGPTAGSEIKAAIDEGLYALEQDRAPAALGCLWRLASALLGLSGAPSPQEGDMETLQLLARSLSAQLDPLADAPTEGTGLVKLARRLGWLLPGQELAELEDQLGALRNELEALRDACPLSLTPPEGVELLQLAGGPDAQTGAALTPQLEGLEERARSAPSAS